MKKKSILLALSALLLVASTEANAATITDTTSSYSAEMGLLTGSGSLLDSSVGGSSSNSYTNNISGQLANNSTATFSFSSSWNAVWNLLSGTGSYKYVDGADTYEGEVTKNTVGFDTKTYKKNGVAYTPSADLVLISAAFDSTGKAGSVTIKNFTGNVIDFGTTWFSAIAASGGSFLVAYRVSGVPLPAALPLFGMGLLAVGAAARKKKAA